MFRTFPPQFVPPFQTRGFAKSILDNITGAGNAKNNLLLGSVGRNRLSEQSGNDTLFGSLGNKEIDVLTGGTGADRFILGAIGKVLYNDRKNEKSGLGDYAYITDFNRTERDEPQLTGKASQYFPSNSPIAAKVGGGLHFDSPATEHSKR